MNECIAFRPCWVGHVTNDTNTSTSVNTMPFHIKHHDVRVASPTAMKVHIKHWSTVAQWRWNTGVADQDDEGDVCGICRVPYEGCCPSCKMPGDDCLLSEHGFLFPLLPFYSGLGCALWQRDTGAR